MTVPVVLDAEGLEALCAPTPPEQLRALLHEAWVRERDVLVPAVVCAESCRGVARTRRVEAALARHDQARGQRPPVSVVVTDFALARQVGAVLHGCNADSRDMVDAHVVAVCALHGGGLVVTADGTDIERLARAVPSARVLTRRAW
ncbi:MAG: PIN domain-containing protein [Pseudonocardiaceae bacterium]